MVPTNCHGKPGKMLRDNLRQITPLRSLVIALCLLGSVMICYKTENKKVILFMVCPSLATSSSVDSC